MCSWGRPKKNLRSKKFFSDAEFVYRKRKKNCKFTPNSFCARREKLEGGGRYAPPPGAHRVNIAETIKYYNYNDTTVYLVLLDASKAFDRVHYGKLFNELCERRLNPLLIRFLLMSYLSQMLNVKWRHHHTPFFSVSNGTKQSGVGSPILFIVFVDSLLIRLVVVV